MDVTKDGWLAHRGDYGTEYAAELVSAIEQRNCSLGCAKSGTREQRRMYGPGGVCPLLALVSMGERVKGFSHDGNGDAPVCTEWEPLPPRRSRLKRPKPRHRNGTGALF